MMLVWKRAVIRVVISDKRIYKNSSTFLAKEWLCLLPQLKACSINAIGQILLLRPLDLILQWISSDDVPLG